MDDKDAQIEYWKSVAAYLADCHAATAEYDGKLSTTSKSRQHRYAKICQVAAEALGGRFHKTVTMRTLEDSRKRCMRAMESLGYAG